MRKIALSCTHKESTAEHIRYVAVDETYESWRVFIRFMRNINADTVGPVRMFDPFGMGRQALVEAYLMGMGGNADGKDKAAL